LSAGDHVVIGPVVFTVQIDGQPPDVRPVRTALQMKNTAPSAAGVSAGGSSGKDDIDDLFGSDEDDPIKELEQLTGTHDVSAMDLGESFFDADDDV
jgi:hypothetical protein